MVKKLISGILKKKEQAPQPEAAPPADDVPEELPPLAEDVADPHDTESTPETTPQAEGQLAETPASAQDIPEELPSLDTPPDDNQLPTDTTENATPSEGLPDEIKKAQAAKSQPGEAAPASETTALPTERPKAEPPKNAVPLETTPGFFASILEHLKKHEGAKDKLITDDLFTRMSNYWDLKESEIKSGVYMPTEHKLEQDLQQQLGQLHEMEQKWHVQKRALEEDMKFLHQREREIQGKVEELKRVSNELRLFKNVKPDHYFRMQNGMVLKNLHDLIDVLEIIDDETFTHHVNPHRNDFSEWIKHVIKDHKLEHKLKNAHSRGAMIELLQTQKINFGPSEKAKHTHPKKYFWLSNGVVIKNLPELYDALKAMDRELYEEHVNEKKNDFSDWVNKTLKDEELAEKLKKARSRKEMVDVLDVYI